MKKLILALPLLAALSCPAAAQAGPDYRPMWWTLAGEGSPGRWGYTPPSPFPSYLGLNVSVGWNGDFYTGLVQDAQGNSVAYFEANSYDELDCEIFDEFPGVCIMMGPDPRPAPPPLDPMGGPYTAVITTAPGGYYYGTVYNSTGTSVDFVSGADEATVRSAILSAYPGATITGP